MSRSTLAPIALCAVYSSSAYAHFKLAIPDSMAEQGPLGDPQKTAPCGQDDGSWVPTNAVSQLATGSLVTITIDEKYFHPGHYRVALAQDLASLPADPPHEGGAVCTSAAIQPAVLPVLADGLFDHTSAFTSPQTAQVQLPAGMTCTNCVLQVIQFMEGHGEPCYYHHCATVTISDSPPPPPDAPPPGDDAGVTPPPGGGTQQIGGCCDAGGSAPATGAIGALLVGLLVLRRRR